MLRMLRSAPRSSREGALAMVACLATGLAGQSAADPDPREPTPESSSHENVRLEAAAERGLLWLARHQEEYGAWVGHAGHKQGDSYWVSVTTEQQRALQQGHVGVTALAALAFLAGGHLPGRGQFGEPVRRALDYVLAHVEDGGFIQDGGTRMYSHAFATLFLAEIYGMVNEEHIKDGLERAVHWIVDSQNKLGGWRYNAFATDADLSVTVCQLQALRAARNIGIRVPVSTIDAAVRYVQRSRTPAGRSAGLYYYKIAGPGAFEKNREYAINAAAVTALFSAGVYDRSLIEPPLAFLEAEYPRLMHGYRQHFYYWYGNYYACQAFFQVGGDAYERFYRRLSEDLLADQREDGRWVNDVGPGDAFSTAVASLILFIPRQYLPIFQR